MKYSGMKTVGKVARDLVESAVAVGAVAALGWIADAPQVASIVEGAGLPLTVAVALKALARGAANWYKNRPRG